jgi:hypothetical protein
MYYIVYEAEEGYWVWDCEAQEWLTCVWTLKQAEAVCDEPGLAAHTND